MSPITPSDSVDAFLTWLAAPANVPQSTITPGDRAPLSDREYAARLRELARSPLEEMAKPLLGPVPNVSASGGVSPESETPGPTPQHAKKSNGNGKKKREAEARRAQT